MLWRRHLRVMISVLVVMRQTLRSSPGLRQEWGSECQRASSAMSMVRDCRARSLRSPKSVKVRMSRGGVSTW